MLAWKKGALLQELNEMQDAADDMLSKTEQALDESRHDPAGRE